jgi:hypothetical protein
MLVDCLAHPQELAVFIDCKVSGDEMMFSVAYIYPGCPASFKVVNPEAEYFQYVGVVELGQEMIGDSIILINSPDGRTGVKWLS